MRPYVQASGLSRAGLTRPAEPCARPLDLSSEPPPDRVTRDAKAPSLATSLSPVPAPSRSGLPALPADDMHQDARSWKSSVSNSIQSRANLCFLSASPKAPSQRPNPMTASSEQPHAPRHPGRVSSPTAAGHAPTCSATGVGTLAPGRVLARLSAVLRAR